MTDKELQEAIEDANKDIDDLSSSRCIGQLCECEIKRREAILLRQITLYKIKDAKKENNKDLELFNTQIYDLLTSFVKS